MTNGARCGLILLVLLPATLLFGCAPRVPELETPPPVETQALPAVQSTVPVTTPPAEADPAYSPEPVARALTPQNVAGLVPLAVVGRGSILNAPVYSPDGDMLAVATTIGIHLYDAQTYREISSLPGAGRSDRLVFSPDGQYLAATTARAAVLVWKVPESILVHELRVSSLDIPHFTDLAFSPDGRLLAAAFGPEQEVWVWRLADGDLLHTFQGSEISFSPDSTELITTVWRSPGSSIPEAFQFNLQSGELLHQWQAERVIYSPGAELAVEKDNSTRILRRTDRNLLYTIKGKRVTFDAEGKTFALFTNEQVEIFRVSDGYRLKTLSGFWDDLHQLGLSPDGQTVAGSMLERAGAEDEIGERPRMTVFWRVENGAQIPIEQGSFSWFDFSPDGRLLLLAGSYSIHILYAHNGEPVAVIEGFTGPISGLSFSPEGDMLAIGVRGDSYRVNFWETSIGQVVRRFEALDFGSLSAIDFTYSTDGQILGSPDYFWDLASEERLPDLESKIVSRAGTRPNCIAFSPEGGVMAAGFPDGELTVFDLDSGLATLSLAILGAEIIDLAYSPDGNFLAAISGSNDPSVQVWQVHSGERRFILEGTDFRRVIFSPDGLTLATVAVTEEFEWHPNPAGIVQFWRVTNGELLGGLEIMDAVRAAFSLDGKLVAVGSQNGAINLWQVDGFRWVRELKGHTGAISGLTFSPDGTWLASGSEDGAVIVWGLPD
jgi:WD40 repeat protein